MEPLVSQQFAAIHASDGNNHLLLAAAIRDSCVKFAVIFPEPTEMTSTMNGSGRNTQLGAMDRALKQDKAIQELRVLIDDVKSVPSQLEELKMTVDALFNRVNSLNIPRLEAPVTRDELEALDAKIDALRVLQTPQVTTASLNALEKRLEAKIAASKE
jgi:hypothetical protein